MSHCLTDSVQTPDVEGDLCGTHSLLFGLDCMWADESWAAALQQNKVSWIQDSKKALAC